MMPPQSTDADHVIVGGGQAGFYASTAIRRRNASAKIVLICDEAHLPYDRVPLSKDYLVDKRPREKLFFRPKEFYENQKIEVISGKRATKLDKSGRVVRLEDDTEVAFGRLLLATGGRPRILPLPGSNLGGIHYLRTIDDCERIKEGYFRGKGVEVMADTQVAAFVGRDGAVEAVRTSRGELPADLVAVGVGIAPNIDLAQEAGLKVDRGIVVNEYLQTDSAGIYAAGDVARFYSPIFERYLRVEHYDVAAKQGMTAGTNMAGERRAFAELPFFFSFMFDLKINAYGDLTKKTRIVSRGPVGAEKGFFQLYFDDGVLNGFLSVNRPFQEVNELKRVILSRRSFPNISLFEDESWSLGALIPA
ncbi:MAG: FAD-dependent oxidoreductase [Thaumarchaeota archaeon]|nr:MAG: FAD-dependent oxidoreductase [Nitrososphaerota archaeon]